jgi:hypothetical protein
MCMSITVTAPVMCESCERLAEFETPYGLLCVDHTRDAMEADLSLWVPQNIDLLDHTGR